MTDKELILNIDKLHTTELGIKRVQKNLELQGTDIVEWCKNKIMNDNPIIKRKGKNWYISNNRYIITVNAHNYTIITAHTPKLNRSMHE